MQDGSSNYDNFKQGILAYVHGKKYKPLGRRGIFKKLAIQSKFHPLCTAILDRLVGENIFELKQGRYMAKDLKLIFVEGVVRIHAKGFGFLEPSDSTRYDQDIFIPRHAMSNAVDGDLIRVEITSSLNRDKGPEGRVVAILRRERQRIAGIIHHLSDKVASIYAPLIGVSKFVTAVPFKEAKVGDRVVLNIMDWGDQKTAPHGEIVSVLGHISDPSCDIQSAIEEFNLRCHFSEEVIKETLSKGVEVGSDELVGRRDFTNLTAITIDPTTAKDFDDALSISKCAKGNYHLIVHIADVAHYVAKGSAIDNEASERGNSVYFPGNCIPMLPRELSENLCSLRPGLIRLTVSVVIDFDTTGSLINYEIHRSYIRSAKRFTYEEAKLVLDQKEKSPFIDDLNCMVELCLLLKQKRHERGSLDFALPELTFVLDEKGEPIMLKRVEDDISHQLVEEFMLKANEVVAKHLIKMGKPVVFRIHEHPTAENFEDFYIMARSWGFPLPEAPTKQDLQRLFEEARGTPYAHLLAVAFIRSMKMAFYSPENMGHYGLSLEHYCHFTSPIRRYTDLIIQRLIFNEEGADPLEGIAEKCSERERIAFKAESSVKTLKKLRFLNRMEENQGAIFKAIVTKVKPFGIFFELGDLMLEGFLHISQLEDEYFLFNPLTKVLTGQHSGKVHKVGESLEIRLVKIDLILLEAHWELVVPKPPRRRGKK